MEWIGRLFKKIFGSRNDRLLKRYGRMADEIDALEPDFRGVSEDEAFWPAPAYRAEAPEAGWPNPGTIAWQVAHLA